MSQVKVREGFVGNSSSTSFCIFGIEVNKVKFCDALGGDEEFDLDDDEVARAIKNKPKLLEKLESRDASLEYSDGSDIVIGMDVTNIDEDVPLRQYRDALETLFKSLGFNNQVRWIERSGYNG